eukprot:scaffold22599_cov139-Cylindrotheca_fusiformis.AAC.27
MAKLWWKAVPAVFALFDKISRPSSSFLRLSARILDDVVPAWTNKQQRQAPVTSYSDERLSHQSVSEGDQLDPRTMLSYWFKPVADDADPNEFSPLNRSSQPSEPEPDRIDFLKDEANEMTYGRRIGKVLLRPFSLVCLVRFIDDLILCTLRVALKLIDKKWYNPQSEFRPTTEWDRTIDNQRPVSLRRPNLEKAWAYFEHYALNRHVEDDYAGEQKRKKAEPGENYLKTRDDYQQREFREQLPLWLRGSATCSQTSWVLCSDCECVPKGARLTADELKASIYLPIDRCKVEEGVTFALRNECGGIPFYVGMTNLATVFVFLVALFSFDFVIKRETERFDENEQTAQDYSIRISNPPESANNPDEWRRFFEEKFDTKVAVVTCAVNNDLLIKTLVERRECFRKIELLLDVNESSDDRSLAKMAAMIERDRIPIDKWKAALSPGIPELYSRLVALNAKVKGLAQLEYSVTNVFVTFETEGDQRKVLQELSVGFWHAHVNDRKAVATPGHLFRDEHVLYVSEPDEPSTIRWEDLNVSFPQWLKLVVATNSITLLGILIALVIVRLGKKWYNLSPGFKR